MTGDEAKEQDSHLVDLRKKYFATVLIYCNFILTFFIIYIVTECSCREAQKFQTA